MKKPPVLDRRLKLEYRPITKLVPNARNASTHPPEQIAKIVALINRVGFVVPVLVDEKASILKGHGSLMAAKQLGMQRVPVIELTGLSPAEKRAYIIADNKVALDSGWDEAMLKTEMADLKGMGFDMTLTGFDLGDINLLLAPPPSDPAEPPTPEPVSPAVSRQGDVWALGAHRLGVGDATKPSTYESLLDGKMVQCVNTDPPYGVSYEARSGRFEVIKGDDLRRGQLASLLTAAFKSAATHVEDKAGWYVWHASATREDFSHALRDTGLVENGYIIWAKPGMVLGWSDYRWAHEPCFYAARQGVKPAFYGDRTDTTIWRMNAVDNNGNPVIAVGSGIIITTVDGTELYVSGTTPKGRKLRHITLKPGQHAVVQPDSDVDDLWQVSRGANKDSLHPTQKPVELARKAITNSTAEGEAVLDMFSGSASTLIACEQTGRICYAIDLEPKWADVGIRRWQILTGKQATHVKDGHSFEKHAGKAKGK
jgi:DNA modification methylase